MTTKSKLLLAAAALALVASGTLALRELGTRGGRDDASRSPAPAAGLAGASSPTPVASAAALAPERDAVPRDPTATVAVAATERIEVRVLDAGGVAASNAEVVLVRREGLDLMGLDFEDYAREEIVASRGTGADGLATFEVPPDRPFDVRAETPNALAISRARYGGEQVELTLAATGAIRGRVTTTAGAPVAGAHVILSREETFVPPRFVVTDLHGAYVVPGLLPGRIWTSVQSAEGNAASDAALELAPGDSSERDFVVGEGALLRGRVTDATTGAPIRGAEIRFGLQRNFAVHTEADGSWRWPGFRMRGMQPLYVRARGYGGAERWLRDVDSGESVQDFALSAGKRAHGRVLDVHGAPLPDVYVAAIASEYAAGGQKSDVVATRSRADGSFELADLRDDMPHFLLLRRDGHATSCYALPERGRGGGSPEIDLGEFPLGPGGSIEGRVVDAEGAPRPGIQVEVHGTNDDWARALDPRPDRLPDPVRIYLARREAACDSNGRFHFANLPTGSFTVRARAPRSPPALSGGRPSDPATAVVAVRAGEATRDLELTLATGGLSIEGTVTDSDDRLLQNVFVEARPVPPEGRRKASGAFRDGRFRLEGLDPGEYELRAEPFDVAVPDAPERVFLTGRRAPVLAGARDVVLALPEGARLRGRVLERDGAPLSFAQVTCLFPDGEPERASTDASGAFAFVVALDTPVALEVRRPRPDPNGRASDADPSAPPDLRLDDVVAEDGELECRLPPRD